MVAGNFYVSEVETGRADASIGLLLKGDGKGKFSPVPVSESGFFANRQVRDMALLKNSNNETIIVVANNDDKVQAFKLSRQEQVR